MIEFVIDKANILASAKHLVNEGRALPGTSVEEMVSMLQEKIAKEYKPMAGLPAKEILQRIEPIFGPLFALPSPSPDNKPNVMIINLYARLSDNAINKWTFMPL